VLLGLVAALVPACVAGPAGAPVVELSSDVDEAPADGLALVMLTAHVDEAPAGAVIAFGVQGPGLLAETHAAVVDGIATAAIWAPFEEELTSPSVTSTATASLVVDATRIEDSLPITWVVPTEGAPALDVRTEPDFVVAGSGEAMTIVVDGRRLASRTVALETDAVAVDVPDALELDDALHGELVVNAPAEPAEVLVRLRAEGVEPVEIVLPFVAEDGPRFDLDGTFARVTFGVVEVGGLIFLDPDPQCSWPPRSPSCAPRRRARTSRGSPRRVTSRCPP
jgi:hypothetical protein